MIAEPEERNSGGRGADIAALGLPFATHAGIDRAAGETCDPRDELLFIALQQFLGEHQHPVLAEERSIAVRQPVIAIDIGIRRRKIRGSVADDRKCSAPGAPRP